MAKSFVFGNGSLTVGLDLYGQVYDLYFPFVGLENHSGGKYVHKVGIWVDGNFHWLDDGSFEISFQFHEGVEITNKVFALNHELGIKLEIHTEVYNEKNILLREILVENLWDNKRDVKIFFNQQLEIYESYRGDTVLYQPDEHVILHYKGRRVFLANAYVDEDAKYFDEYSVGLFGIEGKEGTFMDAEDGKLEKNAIEHGLSDSVISVQFELAPKETKTVYYWMTVAKFMTEVYELNSYVKSKTPRYLIGTTRDYWKAWVNKNSYDFKDLSAEHIALFKNSLKVIRIHTDNTGAIIASVDSDLLKYGRDTYSYVWPRDSALTSIALARTGYDDINKKVFEFFNDTITPDGYFMHKYRSDKSIGSSWHPWVYEGRRELPIQIDETALVVIAVWEDFKVSKDIEFVERIYNSLILKATEFLISMIDYSTGLVKPSYDLWEEKFGTGPFTMSTVFGSLKAAGSLAELFGKVDKRDQYFEAAEVVRKGILERLYIPETGTFRKYVLHKSLEDRTEIVKSDIIDSSALYGLFKFGVLDKNDEKIVSMQKAITDHLACDTRIKGIPRYQQDNYFKFSPTVEGNPWFITTLWYAQLLIAQAANLDELKACKTYLDWAVEHASSSGTLSEQIDAETGVQLSATPLTWSHAEYVITVLDYTEKFHFFEEQMNHGT